MDPTLFAAFGHGFFAGIPATGSYFGGIGCYSTLVPFTSLFCPPRDTASLISSGGFFWPLASSDLLVSFCFLHTSLPSHAPGLQWHDDIRVPNIDCFRRKRESLLYINARGERLACCRLCGAACRPSCSVMFDEIPKGLSIPRCHYFDFGKFFLCFAFVRFWYEFRVCFICLCCCEAAHAKFSFEHVFVLIFLWRCLRNKKVLLLTWRRLR